MLFEIINPSDPYTLEADDLEVAAIACTLLGEGKYSLKGIDTDLEVPFFLFGGHDEWFKANFERTYSESVAHVDKAALVACLDSVALKEGRRRTSQNDIGGYAQDYASALRKKYEIAS